MKTILFLIQKEFIQVFRNKTMLPIIFVLPLVQLIILVNAATLEMKSIDMYVVDNDLSTISRQLVGKFKGSPFFNIVGQSSSVKEGEERIKENKADVVIVIPNNFEHDLIREDRAKIQLLINAINGTTAGITDAYANSIIRDFNKNIIFEKLKISPKTQLVKSINIDFSYWYNPQLNYKIYMVPGILVILVTIIGMFLTGLNIVREKEMGTIEQINVTPIQKYQFIAGKLIPFWIIALFDLAFGLILGKILFNIPIVGSIPLLFLVAAVYLIVVLGLGLFLSTVSENQQQMLFIAFFFILVFVLMSGIFTATESMPKWAQKINLINPIFYFMRLIRMILLKGSSFGDIAKEFFILLFYGFSVLSLAVWRYRKTN